MRGVVVGSLGRCGIHEYSQFLLEGFAQTEHQFRYIGVRNKDPHDLRCKLASLSSAERVVIIEYEPGIFELRSLVLQMAGLRLRGKQILLSIHEIGPAKYPEYHFIQQRLAEPAWFVGLAEVLRLGWASFTVAYRYFTLRLFLLLLGALPQRVIVHSSKAQAAMSIVLPQSQRRKLVYIPHLVRPLTASRDAVRDALGLPQETFAFICPGFLFRRKRIIEVIEQLPSETELWVVGTPSDYDPGYLEEILAHLEQSPKRTQVRLIQDYERMELYLQAADVAIFYYADGYQSGVASLAVGAGKPCIFSDLPAFADLREAGIVVRTSLELATAMNQIQQPGLYNQLKSCSMFLRDALSPSSSATKYIKSI